MRFHAPLFRIVFTGFLFSFVALPLKAQSQLKSVTFRFQPVIGGVEQVYLAGTFNDWKDDRDRMTDDAGDGIFTLTLLLAPGRYEYKFVVDGRYLTDMNADEISGSGRAGDNSIIHVDARFDPVYFERGDGAILTRDLPHTLNQVMAGALENGALRLTALAYHPDVESVRVQYQQNGKRFLKTMQRVDHDAVFEYYRLEIPGAASDPVDFIIEMVDGETQKVVTPDGFVETVPEIDAWYHYSPQTLPRFETPAWVRNGVFYQIFPDRFRNGNQGNDPDFSEPYYHGKTTLPPSGRTNEEYFHLVTDWGDIAGLSESPYRTDGRPDYYSFYGGDIAGVTEKLDYLKDLGITILYFNPLNEGKSNHKYDPVDYLSIDPHFGTASDFKALVHAAHARGIRVIVDKAFNHTGDAHFAFVDSRAKGPESPYWLWYEWKTWPIPEGEPPTPCDYYSCWWDFPLHPNLNFDLSRDNDQENMIRHADEAEPNPPVVDHVLKVADYWIGELGIDGLRLDVPNEVPFWFWEKFRARVDSLNPEAFLIAELWGDALPWLSPKYFHSTMNYKYFREPVINYFALGTIDASTFDQALTPGRYLYPLEATQAMMNLIGSHDTQRFLTQAGGDIRKLKLAALFQMTYSGVPAVYYGDEVALAGGKDPDNRRTFPWDWKENRERKNMHSHYRQLLALRNSHAALRTGQVQSIYAVGMQYAFCRFNADETFLIAMNNSAETTRIPIKLKALPKMGKKLNFINMLTEGKLDVNNSLIDIVLKPYEGIVILCQ